MNQPGSIQVSTTRVNEIFQGKTSAAIKDLMVENAQLQGIIEALQAQLQEVMSQNQEILGEAYSTPPATGSPQGGVVQ